VRTTMHLNEFDLIARYFKSPALSREDVLVGIGDDAAIVKILPNQQLAITTDTLVSDVHFFHETPAADIAYKSLAVNLSDLAAMGATPAWFTLALTLPQVDHHWLHAFSKELFLLANSVNIALIGGDTTKGPLSITIQVMGFIPLQKGLLRSSAKPGDKIYVTGTLGDAGLALQEYKMGHLKQSPHADFLWQRLMRPTPRLAIGKALRDIASSCIDISDGLAADLNHILEASGVGAKLDIAKLPLSPALQAIDHKQASLLALTAGDDYELCFTVPPHKEQLLTERLGHYQSIGIITQQPGLCDNEGNALHLAKKGWQHFE